MTRRDAQLPLRLAPRSGGGENGSIRRREFIALLGGTAAFSVWPFAARAQQPMPVVGFLDSGSPESTGELQAGFRRGLGEAGYIEGQNVAIEYRWARSRLDQLPVLAAELVQRGVAVIAATRSPAPARAAKAATSTIPIVFQTGGDPVGDGLVQSLNRPDSNLTGATRMSTDLIPKRLGIMADLKPGTKSIAMLHNPNGPQAPGQLKEIQQAARARGLELHVFNAATEAEFEPAFAAMNNAEPMIVATSPFYIDRRARIAALALSHGIATMFGEDNAVVAGGLMSYAASLADSFRQVGVYVGRILKGAKPADLPVMQPTKFDLVINLKTAKALGLTIPPTLLSLADEVIE
jgi:putative ABC transport system substrate-binding protein